MTESSLAPTVSDLALPARFDLTLPARRAQGVQISADASSTQAFRLIAGECIDQWRVNAGLVIEHRRMVNLHQMRVGIRRLRSAFSLFRPWWTHVPDADAAGHELRSLALVFGTARDLDVLVTGELGEALRPGQRSTLFAAREAAYDAAVARLTSEQWAALSGRLDELIAGPLWSGAGEPDVAKAAAAALERRYRRVLRRGARLRELSPEKRHEVRIEAKKLRYGCEFFESVYAARWPMVETLEGAISTPKAFSMAVEDIQSVLGRLNDHAAAAAYLKTVGVGVAELDVPALLDVADLVFERWAALSPFWRTSQDRHRVAVTLVRP